ncbi:MAG: DUF2520 domain-containing protein [Myxococcota bacterium]|jgi:predicted short-subunit dehydrogenase-like oxidoreductase (DUF2520 family)|nr:DUF2520 domain-containing protein [Myxococcota bacterium]
MTKPSLGIIGPGTLGTALGQLARRAGYGEISIGGRTAQHAEAAARAIGPDALADVAGEVASRSKLLFLTVRDGEIADVARELSSNGSIGSDCVVAHCSGALSSDVLVSLRECEGVALASFHPLQTLPNVERATAMLPGSHCFAEGDAGALAVLREFAGDLDLRFVEIATEAKPLYHASAVLACNDFTALMDAALGSMEAAGIERATAWAALSPLVHATLENIDTLGPEAALTGPIRRGDAGTVALHLESLQAADPRLASLYRALGDRTLELAQRGGALDAAAVERVRGALHRDREFEKVD